MTKIHLVLQGKGGVGKSLVASLVTQYFVKQNNGEPIFCADTDPVNRTFAGYKSFVSDP
jgi:CO dehydrogenase nickel-insertion accessory protein CooC1